MIRDRQNLKPGDQVWYAPHSDGKTRYRGTVATEPWQLGHGTWVVHLKDMPPEYARDTGRGPECTTVKAAALTNCWRVTKAELRKSP